MVWVKLFKPTWGRIAIFIVIFALIALLDQFFLFFPESPLTYNVFGSGAAQFILYLVLIPYVASCIIPAFYMREMRHAKIHEFFEHHKHPEKRSTSDDAVGAMDDYDKIQESYAKSLKKPFQKPVADVGASPKSKPKKANAKKPSKSRPKKTKKSRTTRRK